MVLNDLKIARASVSIKRVVDLQKRVTFDRNQNRPCDCIDQTRGRTSKTPYF
jgi:hypothetical protein